MAHVGDAGSIVTQTISDAEASDVAGAAITLRLLRPDGSSTPISGSLTELECSATIPSTAYPLPGVYALQFEVEIDASNRWALPRQYLLVNPRIA